MNRMACLRLTQRCAETLLAVRQEIRDAGDEVAEELSLPISKLTECVVIHSLHPCQLKYLLERFRSSLV